MPLKKSALLIFCVILSEVLLAQTKKDKPVVLKEPVHKKMEGIIAEFGAEKAVAAYKKMKNDTTHYYVDWLQLYFLGEKLFSLKRYDDARIIAENNAIEFAERDYVALSMANIYLALARKEEAITFYKKTLQLNPKMKKLKTG